MTSTDRRKDRFFALVERYCQLGQLRPALADIDTDNDAALAEIKMSKMEQRRDGRGATIAPSSPLTAFTVTESLSPEEMRDRAAGAQ